METHSQTRFSETPPGTPKSCMKSNRKLNFEDESPSTSRHHSATTSTTSTTRPTVTVTHHSDSAPPHSPSTKRSCKSVMIKSPGTEGPKSTTTTTSTGVGTELPFQFQLTQHYDNPPPPPNCTSNTAYEEERLRKLQEQTNSSQTTPIQIEGNDGKHTFHSQVDPQLVAIASKVVNEIIQKATHEVASRHQKGCEGKGVSTTSNSDRHRDFFGIGRAPWYRRARGVISNWVTNICVRAQNAMKT